MKKYKTTENDLGKYAKQYVSSKLNREDIKQYPIEWKLINAFRKGFRRAENDLEPVVRENEILKDILSRIITEDELKSIWETYYNVSDYDRIITELQVKIAQLSHKKLKLEHKISKSHQTRNYLTELKKAERAAKLNVQQHPPIQLKNLKNPE